MPTKRVTFATWSRWPYPVVVTSRQQKWFTTRGDFYHEIHKMILMNDTRDIAARGVGQRCLAMIVALIVGVPALLEAQPRRSQLEAIERGYAGAEAVMLESSEQMKVTYDENQNLKITNQHDHQVYFMKENARYLADEIIPFSSFNVISGLQATYYEPRGNGFTSKKIDNARVVESSSGSVFYDDSKSLRVVFPSVVQGGITRVSYTETYVDPHVLGNFYFCSYMPVHHSSFSVEFPRSVSIQYTVFNNADGKLRFRQEQGKNYTRYTWYADSVAAIDNESEDYNISFYSPHVALYVASYVKNNDTVKVLPDVDHLYRWLYSFTPRVTSPLLPGLQHMVDSLIGGKTSAIDMAKSMYYWVQDNIKYVAIESGYSGISPRDANDVFVKRYGDCKDMSSLLVTMMRAAGLNASLAWVGTRDIPYCLADLPTCSVHNHMVAYLEVEGVSYFIDATALYISLLYPSDAIQGKEALVSVDSTTFSIVKVPVMEPEKNTFADSTSLWIEGGELRGQGRDRYTGYMMFPRVIALQRTPQNKQFDYLSSVLQKGSNKFKLLDYSTSRPCRDSLLQVDYSFAIPGLLKTVDSSYYVNLNLERPFTGETIDTLKQRFTKKFDNTCTLHYCTRLAIPDGYKPGQVPRSLKYDAGDFGFESAYKVDEQGRFVVFTLATWVNTIDVPPSRFASWNEMVKQLNELYSHVITIEKAGATSSH